MNTTDHTLSEKLSALLDDELDSSEQDGVLTEISSDARLGGKWQRYHLMRAVIRREGVIPIPDLAGRVTPHLGGDVEPFRPRSAPTWAARRWVPGIALAASLAGVMSLGLLGFLTGTETDDSAAPARMAEVDRGTKWDAGNPEIEQALNAFLVEHGEFTPMHNMNGLTAYARFVSYDSDR